MAQLKKEVKLYIVRSLAVFNTPTEVVQAVQQEFAVTLTRQKVEAYDPTKRSGQNLSAELKAEFEATRKAFTDNPLNIPIANQTVRLAHLQRIIERAGKNNVIVMNALEQAAKEMGGLYTNRKEVTGKGGGPIETIAGHVPVEQYLQAREQIKDEY